MYDGQSRMSHISRFWGGEFTKTEIAERRKLPIFGDFFVKNTVKLGFRVLATCRKLQERKEENLKFSKLFSDRKNNKFQEN